MSTYNFNTNGLRQHIPIDISASQQTIFAITHSGNDTGYFTIETIPNPDGLYTSTFPKYLSGSFTTSSGILDLELDNYKMSAVVENGEHSITFTPETYMSGSAFLVRGTSGNNKINQFISTWDTTLPGTSNSQSITLPLKSGLPYDMIINWGDGTFTEVSSSTQGDLTHTYPQTGSYTVYTTGKFGGWRFVNAGDKEKITSIENWGNYEVNNLTAQFQGCANLVINAGDGPLFRSGSRPHAMFSNSTNTTSGMAFTRLGNWSGQGIVSKNRAYSGNIDWSAMLYDSNTFGGKFNQNINDWDMIHAKDLRVFFGRQYKFNQPLNKWNVSNVNDFEYMFFNARNFNQPLNNWKLDSATRIRWMFWAAFKFNQDIGSWNFPNVSGGGKVDGLFYYATSFNNGGSDSIKNWDVSKITTFNFMFANAYRFNQPIGSWDMSNATNTAGMFGNYNLDDPINDFLDTSSDFNQDIGNWDVSNVTNMNSMFRQNPSFNNGGNDSIRNWNTSNVTNISNIFLSASSFNQPLNGWDTSNVTNFSASFLGATSFDQNLSSWNVENAQTMQQMFAGVTLSTTNYDAMLVSWASQSLSSSVVFDGGNSKYTGTPGSEPSASRAKMINIYNWTITDGGPA